MANCRALAGSTLLNAICSTETSLACFGTSLACLCVQVLEETGKMLKRHKQRFLSDLHVDQQKLRAQLEVLRSDVEAFSELGDIAQVPPPVLHALALLWV